MLDTIYYYVGLTITWMFFFAIPLGIGFWLACSVIELGGWKEWAVDFFGLKEEQK